jgi:hypothetical protein
MTNNDNNCSIYGVMQAAGMDMNSIDVDDVRKQIANEIRSNPYIGDIIRNDYYRYYILQLGFGGKKTKVSEKTFTT